MVCDPTAVCQTTRAGTAGGPACDLREPLQPMATGRRLSPASRSGIKGLRPRHPDDRLVQHSRASERCRRPKKDDRSVHGSRAGRPAPTSSRCGIGATFPHSARSYHNFLERLFNKLKHFRAVATRYDKTPKKHHAPVKLASVRIWMRVNESLGWALDTYAVAYWSRRPLTAVFDAAPKFPTPRVPAMLTLLIPGKQHKPGDEGHVISGERSNAEAYHASRSSASLSSIHEPPKV
jgi:hypothetical protein